MLLSRPAARLSNPTSVNAPALLAPSIECTLAALPSGPYQSLLCELALIGGSLVAAQELPPPSITCASQLTALHCSLHTLSPETLRRQWPAFLAALQGLLNLEVQGGTLQRLCGHKGWPVCLLWKPGKSPCSKDLPPPLPLRPLLQHVSASVAPKQNPEAAAVHELLRSLFADSGLGCRLHCTRDFYK